MSSLIPRYQIDMQLCPFDRKADRLSRDVSREPVPQVNSVFKDIAGGFDTPLDVEKIASRKCAVNVGHLFNPPQSDRIRFGSRHPVLIAVGIVKHLYTRTIHTHIEFKYMIHDSRPARAGHQHAQ